MKKSITDNELKYIAHVIKSKIFVARNKKKVTVFLCGADIKNDKTARSKMATIFEYYPRYELLYPEDLFDDLLAGQGQYSLLELENILADSVDAIVLFPESPGSFAEIGAFSNNKKLAQKMVVLSNKKYKSNKSFINYGPYRLIKSSGTGKVMHINYEHLTDPTECHKIYRNINNHIAQIKSKNPVTKDVANILEAENFILPCIYLIDRISNPMLSKLIGYATEQDKVLCDIATKSSLGRLAFKKFISRTTTGYQVTTIGAQYVRDTFDNKYLDKVRIEVLNAENRRKASVRCDIIPNGVHP
ncbi:retron St85 family effector protein [Photobacterium iliopiscarium]|uniref:retron St85 family effector protein n=1 Tax=Photobacterium iliopiscarium TaxID=56192 RepID=UPI002431661A|nr:retron St85 family effector protein [Photobacterium iliopiscarium]